MGMRLCLPRGLDRVGPWPRVPGGPAPLTLPEPVARDIANAGARVWEAAKSLASDAWEIVKYGGSGPKGNCVAGLDCSAAYINKIANSDAADDVDAEIVVEGYPQSAQTQEDHRNAGNPNGDVITIDRPGAAGRRKEEQRGHPKVPGRDNDEWPPAIAKEGGRGATVRPIDPSDNRGAGATIGNKLRPYPDGTRVRVRFGLQPSQDP